MHTDQQSTYPNALVLIVDDDPVSLGVIAKALQGLCKLKVTTRPKEALELAKDSAPDLLLSDINMPEMDGYQLLEAMGRATETSQIPTIFLTARSEEQDEERGLRLGAVDYVLKPINPTILRERVRLQLQLQLALKRESEARQRADELLEVILPSSVARQLREHGSIEPKAHEEVAVIFCDVVGFTSYCHEHDAAEVVARLDALFRRFEEISSRYQVEKIKTIGDCFMATTGLLVELSADEALSSACLAALEMCRVTPEVTPGWSARAGVYIGPLVSGIVGEQRYQFDVWGNTVNIAARLCGASAPHTIALIKRDWERLSSAQLDLNAQPLGLVKLKGLGDVELIEVSSV